MSRWRRRLLESLGVAVGVVLLAAAGLATGIFAGYQRTAADTLFPSSSTDPRVVVVGIDATTIRDSGTAWPWPRDRQAELVRAIHDAGAAVIVLDIAYGLPAEGDAALTEAVLDTGAVVGAPAHLVDTAGRFAVAELDEPALDVPRAHVATFADPRDGVTRTLPILVETPDRELVPALSLAGVMALEGRGEIPTARPDGVQVGERFIPTEGAMVMRINIAEGQGLGTDQYVSGADLLGESPPDLDGALVFVGVTDPTLGDRIELPTVKGDAAAGVFAHAHAANTILTSSYLRPADRVDTLAVVGLVAFAVAVAVLFLPLWVSGATSVLVVAINLVVAFARFDDGIITNLVYTNLAVVAAFGGALGVKYWTETRHRRRVALLFGRYVPAVVAAQLAEDGSAPDLGRAQKVEVTSFFCDLRGFTALTERSEASDVREILQDYYDTVVDAIDAHGGTVMQFVGDEVFAIFGAPLHQDDHRARALAAALDSHRGHHELSRRLANRGLPDVAYGIGLSAGVVVVGHVGGGDRLQYTVIGDAINVGARLCGVAKGGEIVCPDDVRGALDPAPDAERVEGVTLKGVTRERVLWRIVPS